MGSAGLSHDMGRTWRARVAYDRNVGFVEGLRDPVFSDAVNASVGRLPQSPCRLSRRRRIFAGRCVGSSSTTQSNVHDLHRQRASPVGDQSNLALFAEYVYYNYNLGTAVITTARHSADRLTGTPCASG